MGKKDIDKIIEQDLEIPRKYERRNKDADNIKTYDEVFDRATLLIIYKLITDKYISSVDYPISTGKEANVFKGTTPEGELVALKIYRLATANFKNIIRYIDGDSRFENIKRDRRGIIFTWAKKEFRNLQRMIDAKIKVPRPIVYRKNILVMDFIGEDGLPAPELRLRRITRPANKFKDIINQIKVLYVDAGLVHGDLSEYNILVKDDELVIIDVGQAVLHNHHLAKELLVHDIFNIANYFKRVYHIKVEPEKLVENILSLREDE